MVHGDLADGYKARAPYSVILVSGGAVSDVPDAWIEQLAEGGRLLAVVNKEIGTVGHAMLFEKRGQEVSRRFSSTPVRGS